MIEKEGSLEVRRCTVSKDEEIFGVLRTWYDYLNKDVVEREQVVLDEIQRGRALKVADVSLWLLYTSFIHSHHFHIIPS